jgi:hypothetical protein
MWCLFPSSGPRTSHAYSPPIAASATEPAIRAISADLEGVRLVNRPLRSVFRKTEAKKRGDDAMGDGRTCDVLLWEARAMSEQNALVLAGGAQATSSKHDEMARTSTI